MLRVNAIRPKTLPFATDPFGLVQEEMGRRGFAGDVIRELADYPPFIPWTSPTPKSGPRKDGRRTGALGRGWHIARIDRFQGRGRILIVNDVYYAVFVQGPRRGRRRRRQTAVMRARGWPSVTDVVQRNIAKRRPLIARIITQRDPRVKRLRPRL